MEGNNKWIIKIIKDYKKYEVNWELKFIIYYLFLWVCVYVVFCFCYYVYFIYYKKEGIFWSGEFEM